MNIVPSAAVTMDLPACPGSGLPDQGLALYVPPVTPRKSGNEKEGGPRPVSFPFCKYRQSCLRALASRVILISSPTSTYRRWLEECGFRVTKAIAKDPADILSDAIPVQAALCATKAS